MSSSSEEDDLRLRQIQEATSEQLRSAMKEKKNVSGNQAVKPARSASAHFQEHPSSHFELESTPEFKNYVAKKLAEHIDGLLKGVEVTSTLPKQDEISGIRLLSSSTAFATIEDGDCHVSKMPRKAILHRQSSSSSEDDREKLAAICVSGQTILDSGEGVFKDSYITRKNKKLKLGKRKRRKKDSSDVNERSKVT